MILKQEAVDRLYAALKAKDAEIERLQAVLQAAMDHIRDSDGDGAYLILKAALSGKGES